VNVFFARADPGFRLYVHHAPPPGVEPKGGILHVHAFAEEMNKSRNMVARQARALAAEGWHVLQVDLYGCGDSSGDFGDATWDDWLSDLDAAIARLRLECGGRVWLWGLRAGALLAADWMRRRRSAFPLLLWQPVASGSQYLQQFLRMRLAGSLVGKSEGRESTGALRARLAREGVLEIAGYALSAALAQGLEACELAPLPPESRVIWLDVSNRPDPALSPASQACIERLRAGGCEVDARAVAGPGFWGSAYLEECPALIAATTATMSRIAPADEVPAGFGGGALSKGDAGA
jgi:exosortase A-associated hydrolase 2